LVADVSGRNEGGENKVSKLEEKYFVFTENNGYIEAVYWCKNLGEAEQEAKKRKQKFPDESKHVFIGEILK